MFFRFCAYIKTPFHILRYIERMVEVSTYFSVGEKIHSNACVQVSHRGDTQRHMFQRQRYARNGAAAARDNRSYCCRENFAVVALRDWGDSRKFCRLQERGSAAATIISDSRLPGLPRPRLSQQPRKVFGETVVWKMKKREREWVSEKKKSSGGENEKNDEGENEQREGERKAEEEENETEENSEKHCRVSGKNSLSRIERVYTNVRAYLNETGTH